MKAMHFKFWGHTFLASSLLTCSLCQAAQAEIAVVCNTANKATLSQEHIVKIFLAQSRFLPDGDVAKPVDQAEGRGPRTEFLEKVLKKNERAFKSYWSTLIFTGNGSPPPSLPDDESVKKFVSLNPNAIGYIDSRSVDDTLRVLFYVK